MITLRLNLGLGALGRYRERGAGAYHFEHDCDAGEPCIHLFSMGDPSEDEPLIEGNLDHEIMHHVLYRIIGHEESDFLERLCLDPDCPDSGFVKTR